jgi:5-methylcytosine-specific restriction endonuclease McrA
MRISRGLSNGESSVGIERPSPIKRIYNEVRRELCCLPPRMSRAWIGFVRSKGFTRSHVWSRLRYDFLRDQGGLCQCCGRCAADGEKLNVDHILTRRTHPQFALAYANLQLLCSTCNQGKGNRDGTDWRFRAPSRHPFKKARRSRAASSRRGLKRRRRCSIRFHTRAPSR